MGHGKRSLVALGMSAVFTLALYATALAQQQVSGTVTSAAGEPLRGVTVRVSGTDVRTMTDAAGKYSLTVPTSDAVLTFAMIGYRGVFTNVGARTTIDVTMEQSIAVLSEVIVTGYSEQRRADITGAVASADLESASRETSSSILKRLDGRVSGVTVETSGSPGSRSTVRIRGISSFQNNDPLYIIDGTPVQDSYINWLNPNDIRSIQVLKDASAASIYGSRANNGVVIIETKTGRAGPRQVTLDVRTGIQSPVRGYDDFLILDALEYFQIMRTAHQNAGRPTLTTIYGDSLNPTIPTYTYVDPSARTGVDQWGRPVGVNEGAYSFPNALIMPGSAGTNWWDAVFSPAQVTDANIRVSGGSEEATYSVSFNYFDQAGTAAFNRFQRGTIRLNTEFDLGRVTIGENLSLSLENSFGGMDDPDGYAEDGIIGKNILIQPVVPVYDINGNFAAPKVAGLGQQSNPLKEAWANQDDVFRSTRMFANVFAGIDLPRQVSFRTRFGFNLGLNAFRGFAPSYPELREPTFTNSITENTTQFTDWTWSNTLNYVGAFDRHTVAVLLGQEVNETENRVISGGITNLINTGEPSRYIQDALGDPATKVVSSEGGRGALLSFFGKVDYNFAEKYHLSFTLRRDGSSRLGPRNRWGTFPAIGVGWRLSQESFLAGSDLFTNVMLRLGWGLTGNQNIPSGRIVHQFGGGLGDAFYDIGGTNTTLQPGFRQTSLGNDSLKWEENESINVGLDLEFLQGRGTFTVDVYQRETNNLLFAPQTPATAGDADPPVVNVGAMRNRGIDLSIGYQGTIGPGVSWSVNLNGAHYKNEIVRIDGVSNFFYGPIATRNGNQVINQVGHPIGAFYGLVADGFFRDAADVAAHAQQDGAAPGRIKFRDVNGDGEITLSDRTIIGNPHPDFTAGLDLGLRWRAWDFNATLFGSFGNDIFDVQKEFYVFRQFQSNVRRDLLTDSWTPQNLNARYPRLDESDTYSPQISSFYVEDGSYIRLRNVELGYTVPSTWAWLPGVRVFLQAENLFTATQYSGLDPALPAASFTGAAGDIRDQYRGIDRGTYPSNRTITLGFSARF